MREAAVRAAEEAILNPLGSDEPRRLRHFLDALSKPDAPVPALVEAFKRKAPWETDSD